MIFPHSPEQCGTFKVDVLEPRGSVRLAYRPTQDLTCLTVQQAIGAPASDQEMKLHLNVRRQDGAAAQESALASTEEVEQGGREQEVRSYLDKHNIPAFLQGCLQDLMRDQPVDPYGFLASVFATAPRVVAAPGPATAAPA